MKKFLLIIIILGVISSAYLTIRTLYKKYLFYVVKTSFKKDFNITLPKKVKLSYAITYSSIDFPIEAVISIDKTFYQNIYKKLTGNDCFLDKSLDFLKGKSDMEILRDMYGDVFLEKFPIKLQDFKYCLKTKHKNPHIWKIFIFENKYYLYFFSR